MFGAGLYGPLALHRLHRLHRLRRLHRAGRFADPFARFAGGFGSRERRVRHRRGPTVVHLLLAGLAVFAFARVMTAASQGRRSTAEKVALGALLLLLGSILMSFRRLGVRRGW